MKVKNAIAIYLVVGNNKKNTIQPFIPYTIPLYNIEKIISLLVERFNTLLNIPIFLMKKFLNLLNGRGEQDKKGSDFSVMANSITIKILLIVFSIEKSLFRFIKFPFGIYILLTFFI